MAEPDSLKLGSRPLRLADLRRVYQGPVSVQIDAAALGAVRDAHAVTMRLAAADAPAYGINTGFGLLANTRIRPAQRALLQRNIILSHSCGVGPLLDDAIVRLTLVSGALAVAGLCESGAVFAGGVVSGALSLDALQGSDAPFDPRMHHLRGHDGQARVAQVYRELLSGSEIRESHRTCTRVQDPYSLRCQPQVMGACLDLITQQAATLTIEANAVTDNPLIFPDTGEVL